MNQRSLLLRLTSLWLALLVLTASVGLTVQQHTCHLSGRTQRAVVLTPHHGCAPAGMTVAGCQRPAPLKQPSVKDGCCEFSAHHHKVDASAHDLGLGKVPVPALVAVLPPAPMWPQPAAAAVAAQTRILHAADASPPARAGRALLTFVCVLVV
ncbi:hypothetical protein [Hymenobacter jeollabukensis]|uniref:Uncharacterized protein n=1 Tax=Hymenobacter jeollabukensis TaxID=2025313 RepID=A0A5R8WH79_9BACT|nr:hypothetical protein [Hymenobacter jeollabukensis]TLM87338.1 hypothetical protein FDY95_25945 [Hymenobacter jeollabukensis]